MMLVAAVVSLALRAIAGDGRFEIGQHMIPLTITNAGSYLLTQNITGQAGSNGITIAASHVTIDLNGFTMYGVPGTSNGIGAIYTTNASFQNVTIRNGTLRDWGGFGIDLTSSTNGGLTNCIIRDITVYRNGNAGIRAGFNAVVERCRAMQNGGDFGPAPLVTNVFGMGIETENGGFVQHCLSWFNNEHGFTPHSAASLRYVIAVGNGHDGVHGSHATVIRNSLSAYNSEGLQVASGGSILDSVSAYCDEDGQRVESGQGGSIIEGGVAYGCLRNGVDAQGAGSRVYGVNVYTNGDHGLRVEGSGVLVQHNLMVRNAAADAFSGNAGLHLSGSVGSRIEGNHSVWQFLGFNANSPSTNNFIVRNSAINNTTAYSGMGGNHFQTPPMTNATGALPNDPWRNFAR